jgi:hypothetical protein
MDLLTRDCYVSLTHESYSKPENVIELYDPLGHGGSWHGLSNVQFMKSMSWDIRYSLLLGLHLGLLTRDCSRGGALYIMFENHVRS